MKSYKKFSRFIAGYLIIFMSISFLAVAALLYFMRNESIKKDLNRRLDQRQIEMSQIIKSNLDNMFSSFSELAFDSRIKGNLTNDDMTSLLEILNANNAYGDGISIHFNNNLRDIFIPKLQDDNPALEDLIQRLNIEESQAVKFKNFGDKLVLTIFSMPVMEGADRIGTMYLIYDVVRDWKFWEILENMQMMSVNIFVYDGKDRLQELKTGDEIRITDRNMLRQLSSDARISFKWNGGDSVLVPLKEFPGVFFTATIQSSTEGDREFFKTFAYFCLGIFVLTCVVSFLIARMVSKPIENMANEAIEIAREPSNAFLDEGKAEYFEFKKLCRAFNQVLSSLFKAQEELKSEARKELEANEELYRLTVEAAPDGIIFIKIKDGSILRANNTFMRLIGYDRDEVEGKATLDLALYADTSDREKVYNGLMEKGEVNNLEIRYKLKNGILLDCLLSARRIKFKGEDCAIAVISDNSERKKAEEEKKRLETALQRASKMEAIGAMAGGVAHDLNNILSGIVGYPELLLIDLPEDSSLRKPILTMQRSGEKAAAIVQDMLTLARRGVSVTEVVNLNNIIIEQLKSPEHQKMMSYHKEIRINTDLGPNLLNIIGSEVHLSKTIMNLVSNAVEAMPSGGNISISTENRYIDTNIREYDNVKEGDYVVLTVSDDGDGISPEDRERIFEPFYTKKKMGRSGTGLGMAVVWGTVKDHDGYIDLSSDIGKGSTFKLYFPVTRKQLLEEDSELPMEKYKGTGESVLVVDDVAEQREIASGMLTRLGYSVATMPSGEEAVEYMRQNSADILVLDMIMAPGIDGLETYKRILEIHPGQKAIVASGFSETKLVRDAQSLGAGAYVKKPYLMKNIGPAIRKELDR